MLSWIFIRTKCQEHRKFVFGRLSLLLLPVSSYLTNQNGLWTCWKDRCWWKRHTGCAKPDFSVASLLCYPHSGLSNTACWRVTQTHPKWWIDSAILTCAGTGRMLACAVYNKKIRAAAVLLWKGEVFSLPQNKTSTADMGLFGSKPHLEVT